MTLNSLLTFDNIWDRCNNSRNE